MSTPKIYAPLSTLLPSSALPDSLGWLKQGLASILDKFFYRDLVVRKTAEGDGASYSFKLLITQDAAFDTGANGVKFAIKAGSAAGGIVEIPIVFSYEWGILKYVNNLEDYTDFTNPQTYLNILTELVGVDEETFIFDFVSAFLGDATDPILEIINTFNANKADLGTGLPDLTFTPTGDLAVDIPTLLSELDQLNLEVYTVLFELFIKAVDSLSTVDFDATLSNIKSLFEGYLGAFTWDRLEELLVPKVDFQIDNMPLGLEITFPPSLLRKIDVMTSEPILDVNGEEVGASITYTIGSLQYTSTDGLTFDNEAGVSMAPAEFKGSGIILEFTDIKVDLSKTFSPPEVLADDRGVEFQGVYVGDTTVRIGYLEDSNNGNSPMVVQAKEVIIGSPGGLSGTFSLSGQPDGTVINPIEIPLPGNLQLDLYTFLAQFDKNRVINSQLAAALEIPGLKDEDGNQLDLQINGQLHTDGFELSASLDDPATTDKQEKGIINLADTVEFVLQGIGLGRKSEGWFFQFSGGIRLLKSLPLIENVVPVAVYVDDFYIAEDKGIESIYVTLEWKNGQQVFIASYSGNIVIELPIDINIADTFFIYDTAIKIEPDPNQGSTDIALTLGAKLDLGFLLAKANGFGVSVNVDYDASNGNIGGAQLTAGFIPPSMIGVSFNAEQLSGGGAIWLDTENQRYSGALNINIVDTLNLSAIGIISFKTPDGREQFSFLAIITVEFSPIHLSYGFWLTGVGGMIGLNRGMNPEVLRQGVKTGLYDDILFPTDPVENFERIVTGLDAAFPITQGQFIIGPMLQIGWGGQTEKAQLFQLEIGLIIELPKPVRIALPGVLKTLLPKADSDIVSIKAAFIAILDFGAKLFSLDASLFDSHILKKFTLSGDIAMRLSWGNQPVFVLSVGGFHPEYTQVPTGLTNMSRLTISILDEPRATVKLEAYLAVTSNSVQVGAKVDARFSAGDKGDFQILAYLYFDALFQFNPFLMSVEIGAGVSLEFKGTPILAIQLLFRLEGPTPWSVRGHASFAVLGIEFKVRFDKTFGEERITTSEDIDLMPLVKEALEEPGAWRALAPANSSTHELVAIKVVDGQEEALLLQTYGRLAVQQSIVPLQTTLDKYGERDLETETQYYTIDRLYVVQQSGNVDLDTEVVEEEFARAQYEELEEKEKLAVPAFEKFPAGVQLSKEAVPVQMSNTVELTPNYEQILLEEEQDVDGVSILNSYNQGMTTPSEEEFKALLDNHAAATSTLSTANTSQQQAPVKVEQEQFYVVSKVTLQPYEPAHLTAPEGYPRTRAEQWLRDLQQTDPATALLLQVVPASEMVIITSTGALAIDPTVMANQQQLQSL